MLFVILGRERFALPVGETRIGGGGDTSLPFAELAGRSAMGALMVRPDGAVRLRRLGNGSEQLAVDGVPVGADPVALSHGAMIDAAGLRLVLGELHELRTATELVTVLDKPTGPSAEERPDQPTAGSGGRLVACSTGVVVLIPESGLVIGRGPDSDFVIPAREVSRRHAVLRASRRRYVIRDVSTNGTFVNGRRVNCSTVLGMGDVIRIGSEEFRFEADLTALDGQAVLHEGAGAPAGSPGLEPPTRPRSAIMAPHNAMNPGA
jgi:hypothetical protein